MSYLEKHCKASYDTEMEPSSEPGRSRAQTKLRLFFL